MACVLIREDRSLFIFVIDCSIHSYLRVCWIEMCIKNRIFLELENWFNLYDNFNPAVQLKSHPSTRHSPIIDLVSFCKVWLCVHPSPFSSIPFSITIPFFFISSREKKKTARSMPRITLIIKHSNVDKKKKRRKEKKRQRYILALT